MCRQKLISKINAVIFFAIALFFSHSLWAANNPYQEMQTAADKIFSTIQAQSTAIKNNPNLLKDIVKQDLLPYVQVKYSAALILGNYYKNANNEQRNTYFNAFEGYLIQTFAQALSMYNGQQYQVETAKDIGDKTLLSIRILLIQPDANQQPIRLDFLWRKNTVTGEWKAYDLVAEGVSMITTKQNEWATLLRQGGIDALTQELNTQAKLNVDPNANKKN
ncbi:phospholipid-binding protein MlaC [Orbaceae bacterium ESL0727]|nr:phospholipid-binding protein MlaC [Orbaceae bacterium ESL0727]